MRAHTEKLYILGCSLYCKYKNLIARNMHVGIKIHSINVMASDASVMCIFNCERVLKISLQPYKRTKFYPIP